MKHEIVTKKVSNLIPYVNNARTHSEKQIIQIAASIKEFGFTNPILTDGDNGVIAGHGRLMAAKKLGLTDVPTIELAHLSAAQKKAYILADNQLALNSGWDEELLKIELEELKEFDFDLSLIGFDDVDIDELLTEEAEQIEGLTDEDETPEPPVEPKTKRGDVWICGKHRVMCGDSTSITDVEKMMREDKASLVVTDPPWNVAYGTNLANNAQNYKQRTIMNDNFATSKEWDDFLSGFMGNIVAFTLEGCPIYCVMGASEWPAIDKALRDAGFHWSSTIIWAKDTLVLSRKDYHTQYEPIWYGWKNDGSRICKVADRKQSDLWECKRPKRSDLHPTTKPVELIERAVLNSSNPGSIVFEPFGGSGTTLISCEKTGRKSRLMELDPKYCDVIVKRWQDFTGKKAVLESTLQSFDDVEND